MADERDYSHRPLAAKLGVKPGFRVAVFGAPRGFTSTLGAPDDVTFTARDNGQADLYLGFVSSARQLDARLAMLPPLMRDETAWLIWPKKMSGIRTDLDGNRVREAGLAAGLVDFKVCRVDETWSALAFKRRNR